MPKWKKIMVAIPTINHQMTDGLVRFASGLAKVTADKKHGLEFVLRLSTGSSVISYNVEYQRNIIVREFLKTDCDALWFVDSDTLPSDNSLALLNVTDSDMVGGIYPIPNSKVLEYGKDVTPNSGPRVPILWSLYAPTNTADGSPGFLPLPLPPEPDGTIIEVGGLGTGCLIIDRKILEDERMKVGPSDPDTTPAIFRTRRSATGRMHWTDDLDFCQRARDFGYKIKCHTDVRWGHMKYADCLDWWNAMCEAVSFGVAVGEGLIKGLPEDEAESLGFQRVGRERVA